MTDYAVTKEIGGIKADNNGNVFLRSGTSGTTTMYLNSSNKVGIGTTSPSDLLDINGGLGFTATTGTVPTTGVYSSSANVLNLTTSGNAGLTLTTSVISSTSYPFVGIGTTSPRESLDISAPNTGPAVDIRDASGTAGTLRLTSSGGKNWIESSLTTSTASAAPHYFTDMYGSDVWMTTTTTGSVGIGTTTPAQALEVNGEVKIDSFASGTMTNVCLNGNVLSSCGSSIRYKEKVKPAPFGLNEVMAMRPITFKWKGRDEQDFGLIAEDVEKINPLFVTYRDGEIEGVKYPQLTAVLVKAVQEQEAKIDTLEDEVAALKARGGKN